MFFPDSNPCVHTYYGSSEINFYSDDELFVTIDTPRLHMRSVQAIGTEYDRYASLFGDKDVMGKFATGETRTLDYMRTRINDVWDKRWRVNDPFAPFSVFEKESDDFVGLVALAHGDHPGESELSYLFNRRHWNKGYGSEAVSSLVEEYAPATVAEGYATLEGESIKTIVATARIVNPASIRILEKIGMSFVREEEKYEALRNHYSIYLSEVQNQSKKKANKAFFGFT